MTWITTSLRQMQLKRRVSQLQFRLIKLSQREQSLHDSASYTERIWGMNKQMYQMQMNSQMTAGMQQALQGGGSQLDQMKAMSLLQADQLSKNMMASQSFSIFENSMREQQNAVAEQIDQEKEQLQVQLQAAQAELKNLQEALPKMIEASAVKLT